MHVVEGVEHTTPASIASAMNCYFSLIGQCLADKISVVAATVLSRESPESAPFSFREIDDETVLKYLLALKQHRC